MTLFNIYFGTIGKTLGVKYRFTKKYRNEAEALKDAYRYASSFYYRHEGEHGIPSYDTISLESEITGIPVESLYKEHIIDMCRYYVIPQELDTVSKKDLLIYT